ncbi:hypothetical protein PV08_09510 [Exophiala spinifera]|uniref:Zn(2)-C6 fungal-type domain-containing protein n=1 Tax=Exophiala spinifera TaxID=91928 RepID=A0A0D2BM18_9EURO|nr:uncharacterized protein PV08_09510 [Exophiala spinifera]KIW12234.1 hypothetical protein PV08_09510 [Exophiala spinifera]
MEVPEMELPTIQEINQQLAKRRRKSYPKACYPCRCRKIRCDHMNPCGNCVKHEQPKLCVYLDQNGQARRQSSSAPSRASNASTKDRVAALADLERRMQTIAEEVVRRLGSSGPAQEQTQQLQRGGRSAGATSTPLEVPGYHRTSPRHTPPATVAVDELGPSVHVGTESLASILVETLRSGHPKTPAPRSGEGTGLSRDSAYETMKLLYMTDTGSTHPFTSLWKAGATVEDICLALPDDETFEQCLTSWQQSTNLISPSLPLVDFAADVRSFWVERSKGIKRESELRSTSWLALLFCILAGGCSYGEVHRSEMELNSRVFVCCAFELLRLDNYLLQPTLENVRVLAGLAAILRVQANPAASWSLLGMAIRAAQSIGIHCVPPPTEESSDTERQSWLLWQGLVWQDTTISLCYDRPPSAFVDGSVQRIPRPPSPKGYPYLESCYGLAMVMNDIYHDWTHSRRTGLRTLPAVRFQVAAEQILLWEASAEEYLRKRASCKDDQRRLLHDVFQIFVSFFVFQLHRHHLAAPTLFADGLQTASPSGTAEWESREGSEAQEQVCISRCETVLSRFMSLRKANYQASRLWIIMHICLGCGFYLAGQLKRNVEQEQVTSSEQGKRKAQLRLLRDLAQNFEHELPCTMHPQDMDVLNALRRIIET